MTVPLDDVNDIRAMDAAGVPRAEIARRLCLSRNTVAKYADMANMSPVAPETRPRALWVDAGAGEVRVRRYDARMVVPLTWDEEGVTECAFVTRAFWRGKAVDQAQLHLRGAGGALFPLKILHMLGIVAFDLRAVRAALRYT